MRNSYFHDELQKLAKTEDEFLFLNLGADFSMYSYALPKNIPTIEVDLSAVHKYKHHKPIILFLKGNCPLDRFKVSLGVLYQFNFKKSDKRSLEKSDYA